MIIFIRFFLLLILLFNFTLANSLEEQYKESRIDFLKSSLRKDESQKVDDLKRIIEIGKKLKKDTSPDEKKLEVLLQKVQKNSKKIENNKENRTQETKQNTQSKNSSYFSIKGVKSQGNSIVVDFNVDISQNDIKFFELQPSPLYRDVFDIKGYFKDALATKLSVNSGETITIGQFQPDILRVVITGDKNPQTSYTISKRQLIINIDGLNNSNIVKAEPVKNAQKIETTNSIPNNKTNNNMQSNTNSSMIDLSGPIRLIEATNNKIVVKFNKTMSKNSIKYSSLKQNGNFEYIFDIAGTYKYADPIKLELDNIDKIITTQNNKNLRIRLINKNNSKISYNLINNELLIESSSILTTKSTQSQNAPTRKVINKVIVIDAGHGGDDVGAVGPNKRYEKVVNLNVTKYLENILKQRGYKVYLTRSSDVFIKVMDRTILANEKNADLFISVHTNSMPKEKANSTSGIETFFLSPARNERAKKVAALENKDDIREMSESSKNVFLESLNRPRITASHKFAIDVQSGLLQAARTKYKDVKDTGVKEGPFWVLVGAQMPSILIELGFISHPEESRRLYETDYQQLLANGIANGIDSYFLKNP